MKHARQRREPLLPTTLPEFPWQVVAMDLFEINQVQYLLVVNYFSRYPEVYKLTSSSIILLLKAMFARHRSSEATMGHNMLLRNSNPSQQHMDSSI